VLHAAIVLARAPRFLFRAEPRAAPTVERCGALRVSGPLTSSIAPDNEVIQKQSLEGVA
jgi:hypothetical protein